MAARDLRTPRGALSAAVAAVRSHARAPACQLALLHARSLLRGTGLTRPALGV